jgi:hypothetical protein
MQKTTLYNRLFSFVLSVNSILTYLKILDLFAPTFVIYFRRYLTTTRFSINPRIVFLIAILSIFMVFRLVYEYKIKALSSSILSTVFITILFGIEFLIPFFSMMLIITSIITFKEYNDFFYDLLMVSSLFEGIILIFYLFLQFGMALPFTFLVELEYNLNQIHGLITPILALALLCTFLVKLSINRFVSKIQLPKVSFKEFDIISWLKPEYLLGLALYITVFSITYTWNPNINSQMKPYGVDLPKYLISLEELGTPTLILTFQHSDRAFLYLLTYFLSQSFNIPINAVITNLPYLLNPLLVLSIYFFVLKSSKSKLFAAVSALITSLSYVPVINIYSYYLSNVLSLSLVYLSLGFLFSSLEEWKPVETIASIILGVLNIFTHPWTFLHYSAAITLHFVWTLYNSRKKNDYYEVKILFLYLFITGSVYLMKGFYLGEDQVLSETSVINAPGYESQDFYKNNDLTFNSLYGGLLGNSLLFLTAVLGVSLLQYDERVNMFFISLLTVSLPIYLQNHFKILSGELVNYIPSRILFNQPIGVFSSILILYINNNQKISPKIKTVLLTFIILTMSVGLLSSLYNISYT